MTQKIKCALIGPGNIGTDLALQIQSVARFWIQSG
jgi:acetaldehyde dehydrogenase (acetylating)